MLNLVRRSTAWPMLSLLLLSLASLLISPALAQDRQPRQVVRITAINENYDPNHPDEILVYPGEDVITLSADLMDAANGYIARGMPVEDFIWRSSYRFNDGNPRVDKCDAGAGIDCLGPSNFEVNDYGVSFYVPLDMPEMLMIWVRSKTDTNSYDLLILKNALLTDGSNTYTPPTEIVTGPTDYRYKTYDHSYALYGYGRWVYVGNIRYFKPYAYDIDWVPYQRGYWTYTSRYGLTWVSYDPWGWVTDHYGVWRYHRVYGWIWKPFDRYYYRPHTATFFYSSQYVGWYPYYSSYKAGYVAGYNDGFADGFEYGYEFARRRHHHWNHYQLGWTCVSYKDFTYSKSFVSVKVKDVDVTVNVFNNYYTQNVYASNTYINGNWNGNYLGGTTQQESDVFLAQAIPNPIPVTQIQTVNVSGVDIESAEPVYSAPEEITEKIAISSNERLSNHIPVGSVVRAQEKDGRAEVVRPTTNNKGISSAPRVYDPATNESRPIASSAIEKAIYRKDFEEQQMRPPKEESQGTVKPPYVPGQGPRPTPNPSQPAKPTPPSRPSEPSKPAPTPPSRPSEPSKPAPTPPSRPSEPSKPAPTPPSRPSKPSKPAPTPPSRPSEPSKPAPTPPSRPSEPSKPAPTPPSRPSEPSKPAQPSKPSRPGGGR